MKSITVCIVLCLVAVVGCTHPAYKVSSSPDGGGVPFLPMESVDLNKSVYEQAWVEVCVDGLFKKAPVPSSGSATPAAPPTGGSVDINKSTEAEIAKIAPLAKYAKKIMASRPYNDLQDLVDKSILSKELFTEVRDKLTITATTTEVDQTADTFTRTVCGYTGDYKKTPDARKAALVIYRAFMAEIDDLEKAWSVSAKEILDGKLELTEPAMLTVDDLDVGRRVAVERTRSQVPAARTRYFQVITPYGGTVNASVEFAPNGTMTKASSQVQDSLPGVVTTAVGSVASAALGSGALTTLASHLWAAAKPPQAIGAPTLLKVDLKLTTVRRLYAVTIVRSPSGQESDCGESVATLINKVVSTPDGGQCRASLAVELQRGDDSKTDKPKDGDDTDAISVNGTIKLPKAGADGAKGKAGKNE